MKVGYNSLSTSTVSNKLKKLRKNLFFVGVLRAIDEKSRIRDPVYGSKDPDPFQNVTDPEHSNWKNNIFLSFLSGADLQRLQDGDQGAREEGQQTLAWWQNRYVHTWIWTGHKVANPMKKVQRKHVRGLKVLIKNGQAQYMFFGF